MTGEESMYEYTTPNWRVSRIRTSVNIRSEVQIADPYYKMEWTGATDEHFVL